MSFKYSPAEHRHSTGVGAEASVNNARHEDHDGRLHEEQRSTEAGTTAVVTAVRETTVGVGAGIGHWESGGADCSVTVGKS